jgi:hypothetical protein
MPRSYAVTGGSEAPVKLLVRQEDFETRGTNKPKQRNLKQTFDRDCSKKAVFSKTIIISISHDTV